MLIFLILRIKIISTVAMLVVRLCSSYMKARMPALHSGDQEQGKNISIAISLTRFVREDDRHCYLADEILKGKGDQHCDFADCLH